jgi:superoxide reductase
VAWLLLFFARNLLGAPVVCAIAANDLERKAHADGQPKEIRYNPNPTQRRDNMAEETKFSERIQTADWQNEKHVPAIECATNAKAGDWIPVKVTLGKAQAHPNTTEHHIRWVKCFFAPDGDKFSYEIGRFEFNAHGESARGPNEGPVHTHHEVGFSFKAQQSGTIQALSFCNIHGLWENTERITIS